MATRLFGRRPIIFLAGAQKPSLAGTFYRPNFSFGRRPKKGWPLARFSKKCDHCATRQETTVYFIVAFSPSFSSPPFSAQTFFFPLYCFRHSNTLESFFLLFSAHTLFLPRLEKQISSSSDQNSCPNPMVKLSIPTAAAPYEFPPTIPTIYSNSLRAIGELNHCEKRVVIACFIALVSGFDLLRRNSHFCVHRGPMLHPHGPDCGASASIVSAVV